MTTALEKTPALVLRVYPYSRTSQVVTWLTPHRGRLGTLIKGARRPKSQFLGQYDLFYTCELIYYARSRSGLHIARECAPLALREGLRHRWASACCASYLCDLVNRISVEDDDHARLYTLTEQTLDYLTEHDPTHALLFWFELGVLSSAGLAPRLGHCLCCQGDLAEIPSVGLLSRGGLVCNACLEAGRVRLDAASDGVRISPDGLALLRSWQAIATPRAVARTYCSANQVLALARFLGMFIEYHLDLQPAGRGVALEVLGSRGS